MAPIRRFMGVAKYDDGQSLVSFFPIPIYFDCSGFNSVRRRSANGGVLPSTRDISNKIFAEVMNSAENLNEIFIAGVDSLVRSEIQSFPAAVWTVDRP